MLDEKAMRFLADLQEAVEAVLDKHEKNTEVYNFITKVSVESYGEPFARLYEEGWDLV